MQSSMSKAKKKFTIRIEMPSSASETITFTDVDTLLGKIKALGTTKNLSRVYQQNLLLKVLEKLPAAFLEDSVKAFQDNKRNLAHIIDSASSTKLDANVLAKSRSAIIKGHETSNKSFSRLAAVQGPQCSYISPKASIASSNLLMAKNSQGASKLMNSNTSILHQQTAPKKLMGGKLDRSAPRSALLHPSICSPNASALEYGTKISKCSASPPYRNTLILSELDKTVTHQERTYNVYSHEKADFEGVSTLSSLSRSNLINIFEKLDRKKTALLTIDNFNIVALNCEELTSIDRFVVEFYKNPKQSKVNKEKFLAFFTSPNSCI